MQALLTFLIAHGHTVVFLWVLAAQAGVPVPVVPLLLAAGALAGAGDLGLAKLLVLSMLASLLSDYAWFLLGRRHGVRVLGLLCRISLEPDSCVRRTQRTFSARGPLTLVLGKFIPGLATVAPPLAGMVHMPTARFLLLDGAGALLWSLAWLLPGYLFHDQLEQLAANAALTGAWLLGLFGAVVAGWIGARYLQRRSFLRGLRIARIDPAELHRMQLEGLPVFVVDLRHVTDFAADPHVVPGALRLDADTIDDRHGEIPRDRDVVLYCT
jgi:membrane protein DedA with SNARE-associated domain